MKKSVIAAIVIVAAFVGHADVLYWMDNSRSDVWNMTSSPTVFT